MKKCLFAVLLLCSCQTTHVIKTQQQDFKIVKIEHLKNENYNFEQPKIEKKDDYYIISSNEIDKIIRNNKRFTTIIENNINDANIKLKYYEDTIVNLGGVLE